MKLGKVIRELDVERDEEHVPTPQELAPEDEPSDFPSTTPAQPASVPQ